MSEEEPSEEKQRVLAKLNAYIRSSSYLLSAIRTNPNLFETKHLMAITAMCNAGQNAFNRLAQEDPLFRPLYRSPDRQDDTNRLAPCIPEGEGPCRSASKEDVVKMLVDNGYAPDAQKGNVLYGKLMCLGRDFAKQNIQGEAGWDELEADKQTGLINMFIKKAMVSLDVSLEWVANNWLAGHFVINGWETVAASNALFGGQLSFNN